MAIIKLCYLLILCSILHLSEGVLEHYTQTVGLDTSLRNETIEKYFHLGFNQTEILAFLTCCHGVSLSLRQLKRILAQRGLRRRKNISDLGLVIATIEKELQGSGSNVGYRNMWQRLVNDHHLVVNKETVRHALRIIDPDGTARRSRHRLQRRQYVSKGPNYIWHIDGYDKLKPFGFCVHGCIDGYSRRILWLEVGLSNNNPAVIAKYFVDCVQQIKGTPRIVRSDYGTENIRVAAIQRFFRDDSLDDFAGYKSFMYGRSFANQRIEAWWSHLRRNCTGWWINHFKDLRDSGVFCDANIIHTECLKFCYMPVLRNELQRAARHWNTHRIRPSSNPESPAGRPDTNYFLPEWRSTRDFKTFVKEEDIDIARYICISDHTPSDCSAEFSSLAKLIMEDQGLDEPDSAHSAKELYLELIRNIQDIGRSL